MTVVATHTKFANETSTFSTDFWSVLAGNVASFAWTVPVGVTLESSYREGDLAFAVISGGTAGTTYELECEATPKDGTPNITRSIMLQVQAAPVYPVAPSLVTVYGTVVMPDGTPGDIADRTVTWAASRGVGVTRRVVADEAGNWSFQCTAGSMIDVHVLGTGLRKRVVVPVAAGVAVEISTLRNLGGYPTTSTGPGAL